ncbi:MAG: hypothetical protein D6765_13090, partial [Bacteroidetes bacterium]
FLPPDHPRGRSYILVDEWGPYNFAYPSIWLRRIEGETYTFLLLGPHGNWKVTGGEGWTYLSLKTGTFPATLVATKNAAAEELSLELEFIGEAFTDRFGTLVPRGTAYPFHFYRYEKQLLWNLAFHAYDENQDPLKAYENFAQLKEEEPLLQIEATPLAFTWWGAPFEQVPADRFAVFGTCDVELPTGNYRIRVTSDDGVRLYVDGRLLLDHWDVHVPTTDEVELSLGGRHRLEIEYFDNGGLAALTVEIEPVRPL